MPLLLAAMALLGLAVGSFLNVVIHRVPRGESLVRPASSCPACQHEIRARHNVPVVGWLMLRGRCADCAAPISARYPAVEALTAALFVLTTLDLARLDLLAALPAYLFFVAAGIALAAIDLSTLRLPDAIVYPSYVAIGTLLAVAAAFEGSVEALARAGIGAAALLVAFYALAFAKPGGMGLGDVKLAGLTGAVLGFLSYPTLVVGVFAAFVIGVLVGAAYLVVRGTKNGTLVPFGPALIAGTLVAIFASAPIVELYRSFTPTA